MRVRGLYQRAGSPCWFMRFADENGTIVRTSTGTTEKKLAASILAKKRTEVAEGKYLDVKRLPNVSFHVLCDEWWKLHGQYLQTNGLAYLVESFKTWFGNVPLKEITKQVIERTLSEKGHSASTRNTYLGRLKPIFTKAVEWGMLHDNPAVGVKNLRQQEGSIRFLTTAEIEALLGAASDRFRPMLVVALHTGMRQGEIFRLRWTDVDFDNQIITVQRQTKSGKNRSLSMSDELCSTLRGLPRKGPFVFPSQKTNNALTSVDEIFHLVLKKAGIEDFRFHDLRHTFASHLVMKGVDLKAVQELLGHSTLAMTMRYAHLVPGHLANAVKVLDHGYTSSTKTDTATAGGV